MDDKLQLQLDGLMEKYAELLVGSSDPKHIEMVKSYALYSFIAKSMPPLVKHWNEEYPDAKEAMKNLVHEIKELNEKHRNEQK
ncbi:DUF2573 family protein [Fictibacillus sp. 7GRE50]|uniref:DUF2573 family protein n=1 Tax=Fictibacillus sp. 7GRE50 TaxID=2745878 RepID=UPI0018CCE023|nr:DUF2573 family protein [Fictibacillus sp. 7GRE50]MBH0163784.1 DUF2573 family protein [Fictibacillus sp. 7GRE50]